MFTLFFFFVFFRPAPAAYGGSQARGRIRTVAASLSHSQSNARSNPYLPPIPQLTATPDPSCVYNLHHSSQQRWILNPPREAMDRTRNLTVPSRICFCCATGTPTPPPWVFFAYFPHSNMSSQDQEFVLCIVEAPVGGDA